MWEDDAIWLPHLVKGRRFHGRFLFEEDRMLDYDLTVG
jgi:8-oxo-dGTP diphosphatase